MCKVYAPENEHPDYYTAPKDDTEQKIAEAEDAQAEIDYPTDT